MAFEHQLAGLLQHLLDSVQTVRDREIFKRSPGGLDSFQNQDMGQQIMDECGVPLNANAVLGRRDGVGDPQDVFQIAKQDLDLLSQPIQVNDQRQGIFLPRHQTGDVQMPL